MLAYTYCSLSLLREARDVGVPLPTPLPSPYSVPSPYFPVDGETGTRRYLVCSDPEPRLISAGTADFSSIR